MPVTNANRAIGDGAVRQADIDVKGPASNSQFHNSRQVDPRAVFLLRAAARFELFEAGAMTVDEALDDALVEDFRAVAEITCRCEREMIERWGHDYPHRPPPRRAHRRDFGDKAAASVVDALLFELSRYGLPRLNNEKTQGRLAELSVDQLREISARLVRMKPRYPEITAELLDVLTDQIK